MSSFTFLKTEHKDRGSKAFNAMCNGNYLGNESAICNWSAKNKAF